MQRDRTGEARALAARDEERIDQLLCLLGLALVARARERMPMSVVRGGITCCGMVLLVTPLALWMAWSKLVLGLMLVAALLAGVLILVLVWLSPEDRF